MYLSIYLFICIYCTFSSHCFLHFPRCLTSSELSLELGPLWLGISRSEIFSKMLWVVGSGWVGWHWVWEWAVDGAFTVNCAARFWRVCALRLMRLCK